MSSNADTSTPLRETLSQVCGSISIFMFMIVFTPQLYTNWKRKSGESISVALLFLWLFADFISVLGLISLEWIPSQLALQLYFFVIDLVLLLQTMYYRRLARRRNNDTATNLLAEEKDKGGGQGNNIAMANLVAQGLTGLQVVAAVKTEDSDQVKTAALTVGYLAALFFFLSRIPQIQLNHSKKSCEGLSLHLFIFNITGNLFYGAQVFLHSVDPAYLLEMLPWLLGSVGTISLDAIILVQFFMYRKKSTYEHVVN